MAIRFVDKPPEHKRADGAKRPKAEAEAGLGAAPEPSPTPVDPPADPASRPRGRKTPKPGAAVPPVLTNEPAQATLDGVLPSLPHPKPEPKPRGRKKAFG